MAQAPAAPGLPFQYNSWGKVTQFGGEDDLKRFNDCKAQHHSDEECFGAPWYGDNGIGTKALGGVRTTYTYGVAVPTSQLEKQFGPLTNPDGSINEENAAKVRTARANVTWNGQTVPMPIIDQGPSEKLFHDPKENRVGDLTAATKKAWGMPDPSHLNITVMPNAGTDYAKDKDGFYADQHNIHQQISTKTGVPMIGEETNYNPTPVEAQSGAPPAPVPRAEPVGVGSPTPSWMQSGAPPEPAPRATSPLVSTPEFGESGPHLGGPWGAINA